MGNKISLPCFKAEDHDAKHREEEQDKKRKQNRAGTVRPEESVILKLKIQRDRLETRIKALEKDLREMDNIIVQMIKSGNKDTAKWKLKQKKQIGERLSNYR